MKIRVWIMVSLAVHLFVLLLYGLSKEIHNRAFTNVVYIQMEDFSFRRPQPKVLKRIESKPDKGDITPTKNKVVQTNEVKEKTPTVPQGPTNYVPFYLVEELPQALTSINPDYPEEARSLGVEGRVTMEIGLDEKGKVWEVTILKSPHPSLSAAARKAVLKTHFTPAKLNGQARAVKMQFSIRFRLE